MPARRRIVPPTSTATPSTSGSDAPGSDLTADVQAPRFVCGTCGNPLDRYAELASGIVSYQHPIWKDADHPPVPVTADTVETAYVCDFCTDPKILFVYATTQRVLVQVDTAHGRVIRDYGTRWSACVECAALVEARNLAGLLDRILTHGMTFAAEVVAHLAAMLRQVLATLRPGRALTADGQWDAVPLPATTLPKVRDRLAELTAGDVGLPFGLDHNAARALLAASLAIARLYWIDEEFTVLTRNAAQVLPRLGFARVICRPRTASSHGRKRSTSAAAAWPRHGAATARRCSSSVTAASATGSHPQPCNSCAVRWAG
ncbi:hypothetical protein [Actinoplanes sp. NPDC049681]|uniref:hypothetical protein n=1 Tax=Actinoplanes sp. NPDC049681 TaxID=3363905 RepID=UPI0037B83108